MCVPLDTRVCIMCVCVCVLQGKETSLAIGHTCMSSKEIIEQNKGILLKTPNNGSPYENIGSLHTFAERHFEDFEGSIELRNT